MKINVKNEKRVYNFGAAARYLDIGANTLYRYVADGAVHATKFLGKNLFMEKDLMKARKRLENVTRHEKNHKRDATIIDVRGANFLMGTDAAARYLGVSKDVVHDMVRKGRLCGVRVNPFWAFRDNDLQAFLEDYYGPEGLTHREIAEIYGLKRTTVIETLKRNGLHPIGADGSRNGARVFDTSAVSRLAVQEGWGR